MTYNSRSVNAALPIGSYAGAAMHMAENIVDGANRYHDKTTTDELLNVGTLVMTRDGRCFRYVQMTGAAALLGSVLQAAADVGEDTVSSSSDLMQIETGGVDTTWTAGDFVGDFVYVDDGTGEGQCRRIVANGTTWLRLDRALTTALAVADSDITIIRPYKVRKALAAITTPVAGVAVAAITQNYYGWMQVYGFCEHVLIDDATSTAGTYLVVDDATVGTAKAVTATHVGAQRIFGIAHATNVSKTVPATLFGCTG